MVRRLCALLHRGRQPHLQESNHTYTRSPPTGCMCGCAEESFAPPSLCDAQLMLDIPLEIPRSDQPIVSLLAKIGHAIIDVYTSPKGDTLVLVALLR